MNVCMRWANDTRPLDEATRDAILSQHSKQYQQWVQWLVGYDGFPFKDVQINVVGWAVANEALFQGSPHGFPVYTDFRDNDGNPTCDPGCSRLLHLEGDYSSCPLGAEYRFHHYLEINPAWGAVDMGAAGGEGLEMSEYGWDNTGSKMGDWPVLVHETVSHMVYCMKIGLIECYTGPHFRIDRLHPRLH